MADTRKEDLKISLDRFKRVVEAAKEVSKKIEEERKGQAQSPR